MPIQTHPPETDLYLPLPATGEHWDPHTIHTHYFGFSIPDAQLGAFIYVRYQPAFPLCQGGVAIFRGTDNVSPLDIEYLDYEITMPWPTIHGTRITTANGLSIDFVDPGSEARLTYTSPDKQTHFDLTQRALTPLLVRGHIMPGEEDHHADLGSAPGGSEQFMHCTGELTLNGKRLAVDCPAIRDRSWRQIRAERKDAVLAPPVGWTPMWFGDDLVFNQISYEAPDTDPVWADAYTMPADRPTHHFAWLISDGQLREITRVRRNVLEYHADTHVALKQEIDAEAEDGTTYRFTGEAVAAAAIPQWPNVSFRDTLYRWHTPDGRITHQTYQEIWFDRYEHAWRARRTRTPTRVS